MAALFLAVFLCSTAICLGQLNMRFFPTNPTPIETADLPFRTSMIRPGAGPLRRIPVNNADDPFREAIDGDTTTPRTRMTATSDGGLTTTPASSEDEWTTTSVESYDEQTTTSTQSSTSVRTTTPALDTRNSTLMTPYFRRCCINKKLPQGCIDRCSFDSSDNGVRP
uniref:Uncharacterized protein n=1 Tax=Romanomermis culicivorax TaxID=13658 RepID=A0A915K8B8_ROMCU